MKEGESAEEVVKRESIKAAAEIVVCHLTVFTGENTLFSMNVKHYKNMNTEHEQQRSYAAEHSRPHCTAQVGDITCEWVKEHEEVAAATSVQLAQSVKDYSMHLHQEEAEPRFATI